jgi:hypothetical protein
MMVGAFPPSFFGQATGGDGVTAAGFLAVLERLGTTLPPGD